MKAAGRGNRALAGLAAALLAASLAGCGGGDKKAASGTETSAAPTTQTATASTAPAPVAPTTPTQPAPTQTTPPKPPPTSTSPESQPGGGGGQEPARTELEFRGTKAGVKPRQAGVAPYISVKVTLTSEDGSAHTLTIGGHTAKVGGTRTSAFFTLPGLRPGKSYKGTVDGKLLQIRSTSEPGP
jgi:hypothetical protein